MTKYSDKQLLTIWQYAYGKKCINIDCGSCCLYGTEICRTGKYYKEVQTTCQSYVEEHPELFTPDNLVAIML